MALLALAIVLFVSTNIDDVFVLLGFFADPKFRFRQIVVGQVLGNAALFGASVVASLASLIIPTAYIGLLGLAVIAVGLKQVWDLRKRPTANAQDWEEQEAAPVGYGNIAAVAAVTLANGGDNLGIYTPLFATRSGYEIAFIGCVFAIMTFVWLGAAHWLTQHRTLGAPIRRYGHRIVPFVLIALGILILYEAGSFELLRQ